jgi:hypothetical protein
MVVIVTRLKSSNLSNVYNYGIWGSEKSFWIAEEKTLCLVYYAWKKKL